MSIDTEHGKIEELQARVGELEETVQTLKDVLFALIAGIASSAYTPIRPAEAGKLLDRLQNPLP